MLFLKIIGYIVLTGTTLAVSIVFGWLIGAIIIFIGLLCVFAHAMGNDPEGVKTGFIFMGMGAVLVGWSAFWINIASRNDRR